MTHPGLRTSLAAAAIVAIIVAACGASTVSPAGSVASSGSVTASGLTGTPASPSVAASSTVAASGMASTGGPGTPVTPLPSVSTVPSSNPSSVPSTSPGAAGGPSHDPSKFGFLAKGMSHEVMAFVTTSQLSYAVDTLDLDTVSTIAFFSLEAGRDGHIRHDGRWNIWNSAAVDRLIARAHANGTKVVISLARFAWSPGQTKVAREILASGARRELLAREVAAEVARRGVDGVNVDFEPIPIGHKANFTLFVRSVRSALDAIRPGYQLTFDVTGHYDSYDVGGALSPGGADAVYLMGYHYSGTWSKVAGSTSPLGGSRYDVADTIRSLLRLARPEQLIVGLPYYGHVWPTATGSIHARTIGGGHDVPYVNARAVAARLGARWDPVEQTRWVLFRDRTCRTCRLVWFQLYFDDARSMTAKWNLIKGRGLLGTGVWTVAFEGGRLELTAAMRAAFLPTQP